jgi:Fe-S-cluster-containing dehydrogenase component
MDLPDEVDCLRIEATEEGAYPRPRVRFRPIHCFHCENPACVQVCPAAALSRTEDGFVLLDRAECVACGKCVQACPYDAVAVLPDGSAVKCDGCVTEIAMGRDPVCVRACPMRALRYDAPGELSVERLEPDDGFDPHDHRPRVLFLTHRHVDDPAEP